MLRCIEKNGSMLCAAAFKLRNDKDFAITAVRQNGYAYVFASEDLKADDDFKKAAKEQGDFSDGKYLVATEVKRQYNDDVYLLEPDEIK